MVISIASQKGGVGKTRPTISLAAGLSRKGKRALLVDIDSQAYASKVILLSYLEITKDRTLLPYFPGTSTNGNLSIRFSICASSMVR